MAGVHANIKVVALYLNWQTLVLLTELVMGVTDKHQWRKMVHDAANPHSEDR